MLLREQPLLPRMLQRPHRKLLTLEYHKLLPLSQSALITHKPSRTISFLTAQRKCPLALMHFQPIYLCRFVHVLQIQLWRLLASSNFKSLTET
jgi:hypothetical protein